MLLRRSVNICERAQALHYRGYASAAAAASEFDVVVIGGGPGGYYAAIKGAQLGLNVACVEKRGALGGTCLNVGCIPSKSLLHSSHMFEDATKHFAEHGVVVQGASVDLGKMMAAKDKSVKGLTGGIEMLFKKNKVTYVKGHGKLTSPTSVAVSGGADGDRTLKAKHIVIATGSEPIELPFLKFDEKRVVSSTGALALSSVPKRLVVVGGGVIGLELGSVWRRLGADVTVVEYTDAICAGADAEVAKEFLKLLKKQGINFKLATGVTGCDVSEKALNLKLVGRDDKKEEKLEADVVLVSVGRRPFTDNLGLKDVGVKVDAKGRIDVDDHWATSVKGVYAIGDVVKGPMLAHKAEDEGGAVMEHLASGFGHVNYNAIPSVIYTHPEVAWVGKTEEQLKAEKVEYNVGKFPFMANSRARTNLDTDGFVKILADKKTDKVLGAHIVGTLAGDLIHSMVLTIEYGGSAEDVARTCAPHPATCEAVREASMMASFGKAIHF